MHGKKKGKAVLTAKQRTLPKKLKLKIIDSWYAAAPKHIHTEEEQILH